MEIAFGVTQVSILFKISLADIFFIISNTEIASYADDNTPYIATDNIADFIQLL